MTEMGNVFRRFPANQRTRRLFRSFVKQHVRSYDAIVSFNYDTVFELSLPHSKQWRYDGIEDSIPGLPILKPHGSVNWAETNGRINRDANATRPVIVAPTHLKFVASSDKNTTVDLSGYLDQSPQINNVWKNMEDRMKEARVLVFIGYSFPVADLYFSSILRSVLASRDTTQPGVVIVNPDAVSISKRLTDRFALQTLVRYFDMDQFIQSNRENVLSQLH